MWHFDPSSRLTRTDVGRKLWGCAPLREGPGPHLTQHGQGRGLDPPSRLATTVMGRKLRAVPLSGAGARSPSNTMWSGTRPTCATSFVLIHPTDWPQYTNVADRQTDRTDRQRSDSIERTALQTVAQKLQGIAAIAY